MDFPGLALILLVGLAIGWLLLVAHTVWLLAHPPRRTYAWAVARALPGTPDELRIPGRPADEKRLFESWTFHSRGLDLPVWDISGLSPIGPTLILTHGWGDSRVVMLAGGRIAGLLPLVRRLIVWDMPGHADSPGRCSLGRHELTDLRALIDHVSRDTPNERIVLHGFSLGAIVSLRAGATDPRIAAIIAEAPYTSAWIPARNVLYLRGLPFRTNLAPALWCLGQSALDHAPSDFLPYAATTRPVLILHGLADPIAPIVGGRAIAAATPGAMLVEIYTGAHLNLWSDATTAPECARQIANFFRSLG